MDSSNGNGTIFHSFESEIINFEYTFYITKNYWHISYYAGFAYICVIFGLQRWMRNRSPYDLKSPLFFWNASLALFSIAGFLRSSPLLIRLVASEHGTYKSICVKEEFNPQILFWGFLFRISKFVELGDTFFIVLRKRPLLFLQWYHHLTTMIVVWTVAPYMEPTNTVVGVLNYGVHSIMYPYFAAKTTGIPVLRAVAKTITILQFLQMLVGLGVNTACLYLKAMGYPCARENSSINALTLLYGSFLILFGQLYYSSLKNGKRIDKME